MTPEQALQRTLGGEHAAVYLYGVIGARVSASTQAELWESVREGYEAHRERRDRLISMVRASGQEPLPSEVSYELPNPARTPQQLTRAALQVEERCVAVYADMVGSTSGANRLWALNALEDGALQQLAFGGVAESFPGIAEL